MPALSDVLLTFTFEFSLLFFHARSQAAATAYVVYGTQCQTSDLAKNVGSTFLVHGEKPRGKTLNDYNGKNGI